MNYLYSLRVYATDEDGDALEQISLVEAHSEESLLEQLRKVDSSIKDYESEQEVMAQMEYSRQKEEEN